MRQLLLTAMLFLVASQAQAREWVLDRAVSSLSFNYLEDGTPTSGQFVDFDGEASVDLANPTAASLRLEIKPASIELSDAFRTHFAQSIDWFDVENHDLAVFELSKLERSPDGSFQAMGALTIKGVTKEITPRMTLVEADGLIKAEGVVRFPRSDYRLGIGASSLFVEISDEIDVVFTLVGRPK